MSYAWMCKLFSKTKFVSRYLLISHLTLLMLSQKKTRFVFFLGHVSTHGTKPTSLRTTWARFLHPSLPGARQHHEFEGKISLVEKKQPLSVSIYAIRWICSNCTKYINLNYIHPLFHQIYPENTENLQS